VSKQTAEAIGRTALRVVKALGNIAAASEELASVCDDLGAEAAALPEGSAERELISTWHCTAFRSRVAMENALEFLKRSDWLHHLPERTIGTHEVTGRADACAFGEGGQ